jgi:hypothetical protein
MIASRRREHLLAIRPPPEELAALNVFRTERQMPSRGEAFRALVRLGNELQIRQHKMATTSAATDLGT